MRHDVESFPREQSSATGSIKALFGKCLPSCSPAERLYMQGASFGVLSDVRNVALTALGYRSDALRLLWRMEWVNDGLSLACIHSLYALGPLVSRMVECLCRTPIPLGKVALIVQIEADCSSCANKETPTTLTPINCPLHSYVNTRLQRSILESLD